MTSRQGYMHQKWRDVWDRASDLMPVLFIQSGTVLLARQMNGPALKHEKHNDIRIIYTNVKKKYVLNQVLIWKFIRPTIITSIY